LPPTFYCITAVSVASKVSPALLSLKIKPVHAKPDYFASSNPTKEIYDGNLKRLANEVVRVFLRVAGF
jgi:hypothetical protein